MEDGLVHCDAIGSTTVKDTSLMIEDLYCNHVSHIAHIVNLLIFKISDC